MEQISVVVRGVHGEEVPPARPSLPGPSLEPVVLVKVAALQLPAAEATILDAKANLWHSRSSEQEMFQPRLLPSSLAAASTRWMSYSVTRSR